MHVAVTTGGAYLSYKLFSKRLASLANKYSEIKRLHVQYTGPNGFLIYRGKW